MRKKHKMTLGTLVIVGAIVYLVISGFGGNTGYQVTLTDMTLKGEKLADQYLLAEATLVPGSIKWDGQKIQLRFEVTDGQTVLPVLYNDVAPDNLDYPEAQVILKGYYDSASGTFKADKVETRCPSKYEAADE